MSSHKSTYMLGDRCYIRWPMKSTHLATPDGDYNDGAMQRGHGEEGERKVDCYDDEPRTCVASNTKGGRGGGNGAATPPGLETAFDKLSVGEPSKSHSFCRLSDTPITQLETGKFECRLYIAPSFLGVIQGRRGDSLKNTKRECGVDIQVPRVGAPKDADNVVRITGSQKSNVRSARSRIALTVEANRKRKAPNYFTCIRMTEATVMRKFDAWKEDVLKKCAKSRGVEAEIFQQANKLHITIGVMFTDGARERSDVNMVVENTVKEHIKRILSSHSSLASPLTIRLRGLEIMNDDPSAVDVLYGKCDMMDGDVNVLQEIADVVASEMSKSGYGIREESRTVKLHVTLMNTRLLHNKVMVVTGKSLRFDKVTQFDARDILKEFGDVDFGSVPLTCIEVAERKSKSTVDGFYTTKKMRL